MRLTKRIRSGLTEMCTIVETVLECGGEGWALECVAGPDHGPCLHKDCETCEGFRNARDACSWLRDLIAKRENVR